MRISDTGTVILAALIFSAPAFAQFNPGPNPITGTVSQQTLSSGTGTINSGGAISILSGGTVPLTMSGTSILFNNGTIQTLGTGRAIDSNSGVSNLTVTNTGLISSVSADAFRVNTNSAVSLTNSGTIQVTAGGQAIDWAAITSASNQLTNQLSGSITAVGEDAVRPGTNGVVINAGTIRATPTGVAAPSGSDGIDLRTFTGIQVTNTGTIEGRHGIATDGANAGPSVLTVNNNAGVIQAINGSGINVDGVSVNVTANVINLFGATIQGGVRAGATDADGDGIDVDGVLTLTNSGHVLGRGAKGGTNNAEGIAAGGGTITNAATGRIVGSTLVADAPNGDPNKAGNGILIDNSNGGSAIAATTVTNSGLIQGVTGFAIKMIGTFANKVTNDAGGTIQGAGTEAALQTGDGADEVVNRGAIIGGNGSALDLQGGNDSLKVEGAAASIAGDVSGGDGTNTITFDLGVGNGFSYSSVISKFGTVEINSGAVTLDGADRIAPGSTLALNGGALGVNAVGADGQTFARLVLNDNSVLDLNFTTSITFEKLGPVGSGKGLAILEYDAVDSPDYAIRFHGDLTTNAEFLAFIEQTTINGQRAGFRLDGDFTNVVIPEPSTLAVFGLGGVLLLGVRSRRRRG